MRDVKYPSSVQMSMKSPLNSNGYSTIYQSSPEHSCRITLWASPLLPGMYQCRGQLETCCPGGLIVCRVA